MRFLHFAWVFGASIFIIGTLLVLLYVSGVLSGPPQIAPAPGMENFLIEKSPAAAAPSPTQAVVTTGPTPVVSVPVVRVQQGE